MSPDGAVDNDYDDAEKPPAECLADSFKAEVGDVPTHRDLGAGDLAIDLVTRQLLLITEERAESIVEYYDDEGFDIASYGVHPWLPVRSTDPVYACVYLPSNVRELDSGGKPYDFPGGRLARVPVELWGNENE